MGSLALNKYRLERAAGLVVGIPIGIVFGPLIFTPLGVPIVAAASFGCVAGAVVGYLLTVFAFASLPQTRCTSTGAVGSRSGGIATGGNCNSATDAAAQVSRRALSVAELMRCKVGAVLPSGRPPSVVFWMTLAAMMAAFTISSGMNPTLRFGEHYFHSFRVGHKVGRYVTAVELHPFDSLEFGRNRPGLLNCNNAVLADFLHCLGYDVADLRVAVCRNRANLSDGLAGNRAATAA